MSTYPNKDIERASRSDTPRACIRAVTPYSPADDAGFEPGCIVVSVDGQPVRDVIDWRWLTSEDEIEVGYVDLDGDEGSVVLERDPGEEWGFDFEELVFDGVKQCRNACTFCFMHQLPIGLRPSLTLRDDDFRLSFLVGTFVTLTNLSPEDEARIIEQRISPLRVSLQVANPDVRRSMIGKHAEHGIAALERLLDAGIQCHAQIVLVPGVNDGEVLCDTLAWAFARPGILDVGIVPLGYTRFQSRFYRSFDEPEQAESVLEDIAPFQERAMAQRGHAWVYAADEFYSNAYGANLLERLPSAEFYGDFEMFEDGIGIIRSTVDDWFAARESGLIERALGALERSSMRVRMVAGYAQKNFLSPLIEHDCPGGQFEALYVRNDFFGGNVDVTGLLVGADIARAVREDAQSFNPLDGRSACAAKSVQAGGGFQGNADCSVDEKRISDSECKIVYVMPRVVLNDDGLLLDDMDAHDVEKEAGFPVHVVSCSPLDYFEEILELAGK